MSYAKSLLDLDDVSVSGASSIESRRSSKCASSPRSRSSGHSNMVFTPVHKMYARLEHVQHNHIKWLMVFDKTGSGEILWYNISIGSPALYKQTAELTTCELLVGLQNFAIAVSDNNVYVSGGFDIKDGGAVTSLLMYDADSKEWKVLMGMNKSRCRHTMIVWRNQLLVVGGIQDSSGRMTHTCELYNMERDQWVLFENLPEPRADHACVSHNGDVYISGGYNFSNTSQNNTWIYEQSVSRWRQLDEDCPVMLPYSTARHRMVSHYDSIYLITGIAGNDVISFKPSISYLGTGALSKDLNKLKYDRVTPWNFRSIKLPKMVCAAALYQHGNTLVVFGGTQADGRSCGDFIYIDLEHKTVNSHISKSDLPKDCECAVIEVDRYRSLSQHLVQRNWPLW